MALYVKVKKGSTQYQESWKPVGSVVFHPGSQSSSVSMLAFVHADGSAIKTIEVPCEDASWLATYYLDVIRDQDKVEVI